MSIRDDLVTLLRGVVGPDEDVHIVAYQDTTDELDRPTIVLKQRTIARLEEAPSSDIRVDYVLTFIAPHSDIALAEQQLDVWVVEVLDDLRVNWLSWTLATKVLWSPLYWGYDVDCYVITTPAHQTNKGA